MEAEITQQDSLIWDGINWFDKWRKSNTLGPIQDQETGNCCFAFAICGVIEAVYFIKKGKRIELSIQDVYNHLIKNEIEDEKGCSLVSTLKFISEEGCVLKETCPYKRTFQPIDYSREAFLRVETFIPIDLQDKVLPKKKSKSLEKLEKTVEEEIRIAPVAAHMVWIAKDMEDFKGSGIYSGPEKAADFENSEGHGVMIVGFGEEIVEKKLKKYWIIRNSHGERWGDKGYGKIDRAPCHGRLIIENVIVVRGVTKVKQKQ